MRLLPLQSAADRLGISTASVRRLCDLGKLESVRPCGPTGHRRIVDESVDIYLASLRSEAAYVPPAPIPKLMPVFSNLEANIARAKRLRLAKAAD